jgi:hypothetical protein
MKRYTARLRLLDSQLNTAQIKTAVESELLRAPITFKVGAIAPAEGDIVLVEIASDAKRADLARMLKGIESTRRLQLECVGWGWLITDTTIQEMTRSPGREYDPYAAVQAQTEDVKEYTYNIRSVLIEAIPGTVYWIGWMILVGILYRQSLVFVIGESILGGLLLYVFRVGRFLASTPRLRCDQNGIEIKYLLRRSPRRQTWAEIWGLDSPYIRDTCTVRSGTSSKFSTKGLNEMPTLIKTIVKRASLNFVEGATYRRFDAE